MAIHIADDETDWLVREFARRRGLGITAAIKTAVLEATERDKGASEALAQRLEPILKQVRAYPKTAVTKEDDDDLWSE